MKIVFFGTPEFAVAPLRAIFDSRHTVLAVVSQPNRAKNRKGELLPTPVAAEGKALGAPVFQPEKIKQSAELLERFAAEGADIFVTAAYGQILNSEILSIPKYGVINVHASMLPKYRGSSPVQWALMNGEKETGVTIMQTALGVDTGDILLAQKEPIFENDTTGSLLQRLSKKGATLLAEALDGIEAGKITPIKQKEAEATHFPMLTKEMGLVDFGLSAMRHHNKIRAISCHAILNGNYTKIIEASVFESESDGKGSVGKLTVSACGELLVQCKKGTLKLIRLQPQNKNIMTAKEYISGYLGGKNG